MKRDFFAAICLLVGTTTALHAAQVEQQTASLWYDGDRVRQLWPIADQGALFIPGSADKDSNTASISKRYPQARVISKSSAITLFQLPSSLQEKSADNAAGRLPLRPVYRSAPDANAPQYIGTGQLIVHFVFAQSTATAARWGASQQLKLLRPLKLDNAFLYNCPSDTSCIQASNQLKSLENIKYAYPNWVRPRVPRQTTGAPQGDPLFSSQWHLENTGQTGGTSGEDINITPAWTTFTGSESQVIGIVDDGTEIAHEDLQANVIPGLSWDYVGNDPDPTGGQHGTSTAGLAVARGGNGIGISGVAPEAGLAGIRLLGAATDTNEAAALTHLYDQISIYSNSWGSPDGIGLDGPGPLTQAALRDGATNGRDGKGVIYTWAGGNGLRLGDNSNYDGFANQPFVIAVSAITDTGIQAYYSEPGANLLLTAPGGDTSGWITTTDRTGFVGFNPGNYYSSFGGTSASAPQVAGAVALMLQANPDLGWRDVRKILANTAIQNHSADPGWQQNGAGHWINHKYGYGRIDASGAVDAALAHSNLPPLVEVSTTLTPGTPIPDNDPAGITSSITIDQDMTLEFVQLVVDSDHSYWGDLEIRLTSPEGTESILAEKHNSSGAQLQGGWAFGVARLMDESSQGEWTLQVIDQAALDTGQLTRWEIKLFGHSPAPPPLPPYSIPGLSGWGVGLLSLLLLVSGGFAANTGRRRRPLTR